MVADATRTQRTMKILQLCAFNNFWSPGHEVESWVIKFNKNVLDLPDHYGNSFDFIISAPPCDQFTKASSWKWEVYPDHFIKIANKCLTIQLQSNKPWVMESVPGRIETFIPELKYHRITSWRSPNTNKEPVS